MGYRIEGDGTKHNTKVWKDGVLVNDWGLCIVNICKEGCTAYIDGVVDHLDRVVLIGVYRLIGDGDFANTKLFMADEMLRGISSLTIRLEYPEPIMWIMATFLPHIIEGEE